MGVLIWASERVCVKTSVALLKSRDFKRWVSTMKRQTKKKGFDSAGGAGNSQCGLAPPGRRLALSAAFVLAWLVNTTGVVEAGRISLVGDSITAGTSGAVSYQGHLETLLGPSYEVSNFGRDSATLRNDANAPGTMPYTSTSSYTAALASTPDIVVIMLGTNDGDPANWDSAPSENNAVIFKAHYQSLISDFQSLASNPSVYVATPPPVFGSGAFNISPDIVNNEIVPLVQDDVGVFAGVTLIDVNSALTGRSDLFPDNIHPNEAGAQIIAETIYSVVPEPSTVSSCAVLGLMMGLYGVCRNRRRAARP